MIAKAATIQHGANAIHYSVGKDKAEVVRTNLLPDDLTPESMYTRMMLTQRFFAKEINRGKPLKRNMVRMEISPSSEESAGWNLEDWGTLADEYIRVFDSIDLSQKTRRASAKSTNIGNSQYVVVLHKDSASGIFHLHINANRVDQNGKVNDDHMIFERAMQAANIINERRGWVQSEDISTRNKEELTDACMQILAGLTQFSWSAYEKELKKAGYGVRIKKDSKGIVRGYSIAKGNSIYKSSELGKSRNLTPSRIEKTWAALHPQVGKSEQGTESIQQTRTTKGAAVHTPDIRTYTISTDERHTYRVDIPSEIDRLLKEACKVDEDSFATLEDVHKTALLLFAEYLDGATEIAVTTGGGGGGPTDGWGRDPKEDDREWAQRCAQMANHLCRRRRGLRR